MLFEATIAVEQEVIAADITIARASYTVFTRFGCTPTQHVQSKPSRDFALRQWLPTK